MPARNNIEIIVHGRNEADGAIKGVEGRLDSIAKKTKDVGGALVAIAGPPAAAFIAAGAAAMTYDESLTNIQAVTGKTDDEIKNMSASLMAMARDSRFGPQAVADSMYDIVGGVADATTHMDILQNSINLAEAGNANLAGTTQALISVMNSYKFSAEEAGFASDVLTQTVGMGVGTMDEFAAALPQVTGLAQSLGIGFDELGGMTAYLTTQGNSASGAVTQLSAMMTALLNPNEAMKQGLQELGFTSGQAAIDALGLTGAYEALAGTHTANEQGMAKMTGSVEALRGVTALAGPDVKTFMADFKEGVEGATAAAQAVQMDSAAAQFDVLRTNIEAVGIKVGESLLPAFTDILTNIQPVIDKVIEWIGQNPELVSQIGMIAIGATALGGVLMVASPIISGVSTVIGLVSAASGILSAGWTVLSGIAGVFSGVLGAVSAGATAALAPLGALAAPIIAVTAAAVAAIAAVKQLIDTVNMVNQAGSWAQGEIAPKVASGEISKQDVYDKSFNAISSQFGGGIFGDVAARLFYTNVANTVAPGSATGMETVPRTMLMRVHAGEGILSAEENRARLEGQPAGPVLNFGAGSVIVQANSAAEGRAAADGFEQRLNELLMAAG